MRVLLASDVAAEGLNLHYLCHRLIHFDVPWSLMVFQQRNGRIDRYGQEKTPEIVYLLTDSENPRIKGDTHILDLLIIRDMQARKNIGDPSALMGVYDIDAEECFTAKMMEDGLSPDAANTRLGQGTTINPLELLLGGGPVVEDDAPPKNPLSLFNNDFDYLCLALDRLADVEGVERKVRAKDSIVELRLPPLTEDSRRRRLPALDLRRRFHKLPLEVLPDDGVIVLTPNKDTMQRAIVEARREETAWP
ncbi:MAG: SWF/SNF helicase family protein [Proteobacteria bacterium]|nr:SWF/SNF helicase family protein [Pseudomonadota bacterium]